MTTWEPTSVYKKMDDKEKKDVACLISNLNNNKRIKQIKTTTKLRNIWRPFHFHVHHYHHFKNKLMSDMRLQLLYRIHA